MLDLASSGRDPSGLGVGWVDLCGRMTACVGRTDVGGARVPTRLRSDLARFCRIRPRIRSGTAREGLDRAIRADSGPRGSKGVELCGRMTAVWRLGRWRGAGTDPSSLGSRPNLWDPSSSGSGGPRSCLIRSRSERTWGPRGSVCAAVRRPAYSAPRRGRGAGTDPSSLGSRPIL